MTAELADRISLRNETDSDEDKAFHEQLFRTLESNQMLLQMGPQGELLIAMQLKARDQQYHAQYPDANFQMIEFDDQLAGRIVVDRSGEEWHLVDIAILPELRSQGIGSHLVKELLLDASREGIAVRASVMGENTGAQRLWTRLGFQVVELRPDFWSLRFEPASRK